MYVVIFEKNILYLGKSIKKTIEIFSKKNNSEIFRVDNIEELYKLIEKNDDIEEVSVSDTAQKLLDKLDSLETKEEVGVCITSQKNSAEVQCVGVQNIKVTPEFLQVVNNPTQETDGQSTFDIREYLKHHDI